MAEEQLHHLVKMANQIALNLAMAGDEDEIASQIYGHIKNFWSPLMKEQIKSCIHNKEMELAPTVCNAISRL